MSDIQILFVRRQSGPEQLSVVTHLGNKAGQWTCRETIDWIESGAHRFFYLTTSGDRVNVIVMDGPDGKRLGTSVDGPWTGNLPPLPEFPPQHAVVVA